MRLFALRLLNRYFLPKVEILYNVLFQALRHLIAQLLISILITLRKEGDFHDLVNCVGFNVLVVQAFVV